MISGNRPKVLFVTHKYPPSLGGMQQQSFEVIRNYREIEEASLIAYTSRYPVWLFFIVVIPWVAIKLIADREIDVIHGNDGLMAVFLTPFLLTGKKLFATVHGVDIFIGSPIYQWWVRTCLRRFDGVIAVSHETAQGCVERGIPKAKVSCVLNTCDRDWRDERDPEFATWLKNEHGIDIREKVVIATVGRAVPRKGYSWFASQVLPKLPENAFYVFVGPTSEQGFALRLVRTLLPHSAFMTFCHAIGVESDFIKLKDISLKPEARGRLAILGPISRSRLNQLYLHCHILVMPNLRVAGDFEGFGLVAQEAAYNGALCIGANVDGIPSAITHGETGLLLPSAEDAVWVDKISEFCLNKDQLKTSAEAYQKAVRASDYSWMDVALAYRERFGQGFKAPGEAANKPQHFNDQ